MTHLARTLWDCVIYHHSINSMLGCFVVLVQDPLLAFPFRYLGRFGAIPREARTLNPIKPAKKKDYLTLCQALLQTHPDESTRRSVEFLVQICSGTDPEPVPILAWRKCRATPHSTGGSFCTWKGCPFDVISCKLAAVEKFQRTSPSNVCQVSLLR